MITTGEASIQHYRVIGRQLIVSLMFYVSFVATALPIILLVPWPPIRLPTNDNEFEVRSLAIWACVLGAALGIVLPLLSCVHVALWVERVSLPESCPRPAMHTGCRHRTCRHTQPARLTAASLGPCILLGWEGKVFANQVVLGKLMLLPEGYHQKTYQRGSWEWYRSTAVSDFVNTHRVMFHSGLSGTDAEVWVCCLAHGRWI